MPLNMRYAAEADIDGIARVATAAFDPATDTIARNLFPASLQRANSGLNDEALAWRRAHKGIKTRTDGVVLIVVTDDELENKIVGFSLWEEPVTEGHVAKNTPQESIPCETMDKEAYQTLRRVTAEACVSFLGKDGYKHMWYLDYLGVDPDHQRRGIGKMLLHWGLKKAAEENRDVFLIATPAGVPLYQVMGFEDLGSFMLFDTPHTGFIKRRLA